MLFMYDKNEVSITESYFTSEELTNENKRVYVIYDTSTGTNARVNGIQSYSWRTQTDSLGKIYINNSNLYPTNQKNMPEDYTLLDEKNFIICSIDEYYCLKQVINRVDMVNSRLPTNYQKKFSFYEYAFFLDRAVWTINFAHPITQFVFKFTTVSENENQFNNYNGLSTLSGKVPRMWWPLLVERAMIESLIDQNVLEVDISFNYSDQGINLGFNNAQGIQAIWTQLFDKNQKSIDKIKQHYRTGIGIGTYDSLMGGLGRHTVSGQPGIAYFLNRRG